MLYNVCVHSGGKAKLRTFREEVDLFGIKAVCEASDQIDSGVQWSHMVRLCLVV